MHVQTPNPALTDEQREAQMRSDLRWWLTDQAGRRIARMIHRWSGCDETGPLGGIEHMAEATGRRQIGNLLKATIRKYVPELWLAMESEHVQELVRLAQIDEQKELAKAKENPA